LWRRSPQAGRAFPRRGQRKEARSLCPQGPALVFDMIEPFRILGKRATLLLYTVRRVLKKHFEEVPGGVALSKDGWAFFLGQFNERLDKVVRYPVQGYPGQTRNVKIRDTIQHEAHG